MLNLASSRYLDLAQTSSRRIGARIYCFKSLEGGGYTMCARRDHRKSNDKQRERL